ncbi:glycosyltransferase family A protein [Marinobacter sp. BGYM27]|uniref:glycosyltransferase family A protein n=1 Tax=unclassified Marinobacter TaxID=83889 RepID=UPI0021A260B0|nr:glycosyltransferase family A protein [Marinobacter sp. BGYM27]MDG5501333.1 glycosyltransferase family A protein [Marinobacter sp. BGYM27]
MKVKEYPPSLARMIYLNSLNAAELHGSSRENELPVIVSLTSIESRLKCVHLAVRSVLRQSQPPKKIILWLGHECEKKIPEKLHRLQGQRFEIRFRPDVGPHTKLIYCLKEHPSETIVTCDDDLMYPQGWLQSLYHAHRKNPDEIVGHQCRRIRYSEARSPAPYRQWTYEAPDCSDKYTMPLGYGGVLYPPHSLSEMSTSSDLFLKLSPKADDLWFKAMSLLAGTSSRKTMKTERKPYPIPFSQGVALKKSNVREDANRDQWMELAEHFDLHP